MFWKCLKMKKTKHECRWEDAMIRTRFADFNELRPQPARYLTPRLTSPPVFDTGNPVTLQIPALAGVTNSPQAAGDITRKDSNASESKRRNSFFWIKEVSLVLPPER